MSILARFAWRLALGALLLLALFFLCPPVCHAGPEPEAVLPSDRTAGEPAPAAAVAQDCTDPMRNGGFESGTFAYWSTSGSPSVLSTDGHSGSHCALLGGRPNAVDVVYQTMPCPFDSQGLVGTAWVYVHNADGLFVPHECLTARLTSSSGAWLVQQICSVTSPRDVWMTLDMELSGLQGCPAGGTYQWSFTAATGDVAYSSFLVDDVLITACPACTGNGVCLCEDINYGGACHTWTSDDPELGDDGWHDRASSIQFVGSYAGGRARATLYEHAYYSGASTTFTADDPWLGDDAIGNDSTDSIRIEMVPFCDLVTEIPKVECAALVELYNSTLGPYWTRRDGWLATYTPCSWYGVRCAGGHVSELLLQANNLNGSIPSSLGNLSNLVRLDLPANQLSGSIPSSLGNLSHLVHLYLYSNQLGGSIPSSLGNLSNLTFLYLYSNQLSGSIPSTLGDLSNLDFLWLYSNQLSGSIPSSLGGLSNLTNLNLGANQLSGSIPSSLGGLSNLRELDLAVNQLSGSIPSSLDNLSNLGFLFLSRNQLSGGIPSTLGDLYSLRLLGVDHNQLSGVLPQNLKNLSLVAFWFNDTDLCEPPDAAFQAWLLTIRDLQRTNVLCPTPTPPTPTSVSPTPQTPTPSTPTPTSPTPPTPTSVSPTPQTPTPPTPTPTSPTPPTPTPTATRTRTPTATIPGTVRRVYLPLVMKGFWSPRPEDCTELFTNGNFESGGLADWRLWGDITLGAGRNSANGGQLGGRNNAEGELWQGVFVPAGANPVTWDFWWKAEAGSPQPGDNLHVYVESGQVLTTLMDLPAEAPLSEWRHVVLDLSQWAGRWVMAAFQVGTDGSVPATFRVDDVSVRSCVRP